MDAEAQNRDKVGNDSDRLARLFGARVKRGQPGASKRRLELEFTGVHAEYFRLWLTNLCLSLFTLGVFSAWAKVRKKRYLYSHTLLDGTPFEYRGRPIPILKGRIVAAVLFALWFAVTRYFGSLSWVVLLVALAVLPWMIVRTLSFNARSSAYRNMTFDFRAGYAGGLRLLVSGALLTTLTCGLGFGAVQHRLSRFFVQNVGFGGLHGRLYTTSRPYVLAYLKAAAVLAALLIGLGLIIVALDAGEEPTQELVLGLTVAAYAAYVGAYTYTRTFVQNTTWNESELGPVVFESRLVAVEVAWLYFSNALAILLSCGLLIPWATLRMLQYRVSCLNVFLHGELAEFRADPRTAPNAVGAELADFFELDLSL